MTQVVSRIAIQAPADLIWQVLKDFSAASRYLAGVVNCRVEGAGVGALRTLTNADNSTLLERLEGLDGEVRQLSYLLLTDTPFRNCLTTIAVREIVPRQAELEWSVTFEPVGIPASEAVEMLTSALAANCRVLKESVEH